MQEALLLGLVEVEGAQEGLNFRQEEEAEAAEGAPEHLELQTSLA